MAERPLAHIKMEAFLKTLNHEQNNTWKKFLANEITVAEVKAAYPPELIEKLNEITRLLDETK